MTQTTTRPVCPEGMMSLEEARRIVKECENPVYTTWQDYEKAKTDGTYKPEIFDKIAQHRKEIAAGNRKREREKDKLWPIGLRGVWLYPGGMW